MALNPSPQTLCDKCIHFTTDYRFHTGEPIPLDDRLAHRLSYTNEIRFFFRLPWQCNDSWPDLPRLQESFLAGCTLCGVIRTKLLAGNAGVQQSGLVVSASEITIRAEYGFEDRRPRKPVGVSFDYQVVGQPQWHRTVQQPSFVLAASRGKGSDFCLGPETLNWYMQKIPPHDNFVGFASWTLYHRVIRPVLENGSMSARNRTHTAKQSPLKAFQHGSLMCKQ